MNVSVIAAGWVNSHGYGTLENGEEHLFSEGETIYSVAKNSIFNRPVRNFGRLDRLSRITLATVALALKDAGIESSPVNKVNIGIIGTNSNGSLETDCDFFRDYLDNGRKLARANLFIYTLSSSPLGEASIHFGLKGPLLYTTCSENPLKSLLSTSMEMVAAAETDMCLAGITKGDEGIYFLLATQKEPGITPIADLLEAVGSDSDVSTVVTNVRQLMKRG
jgi:hypothetical protein